MYVVYMSTNIIIFTYKTLLISANIVLIDKLAQGVFLVVKLFRIILIEQKTNQS